MKRSFNKGLIFNIGYKADFESIAKRACFQAKTKSITKESRECAPMEIEYPTSFEEPSAANISFWGRKKRLADNEALTMMSHKMSKTTYNNEDDDDLMEIDETVNGVAPMEVEERDFYFTPMDICSYH